QVAPVAAVLQLVVVAALLAGHVAVVEGGRVARTADIGRVVEEGGDQAVVLGDLPGGLEERVARVALHRAHRGARGRVKHVVFAVLLLVRGEEPQLLLDDRAAQGEGGVVGGEAAGLAVFVLGDQVVVLQVVVDRAVPLVATGLGDHLGDQARAAGVLGGHAAGDDLLLLDDLGVEVRTEGAGVVVGDVDAVDQVDVVGGAAAGAADVAVVDAGLGRRVAAGAGLHARDQLQVALVAAAGGQRFHHLQGQRGAHGGRGGVDGRQRGAGNDDRVEGGGIAGGAAAAAQAVTQAEVAAGNHRHVGRGVVLVAGRGNHHGVVGRRVEALQAHGAVIAGDAALADETVRRTDPHGCTGNRLPVSTGDADTQAAGIGGPGGAGNAHAQREAEHASLDVLHTTGAFRIRHSADLS